MGVEHRVVGPPGTGKTTYLTRQAVIAAEKYGADQVAIASLTRTAAKEIASRGHGIPHQNVGTLHAHAYRRLDRPALAETSEGVAEWNEACGISGWRLSRRSISNPEHSTPEDMGGAEDGGDGLLADIGVLRARCIPVDLWPARLQQYWRAWCKWKRDAGRLDFTDLIERAIDQVPDLDAGILMLDEAQDMSKLELQLARQWGDAADQIVVVGDPDQNLYEWRGSDPAAFYAAEAETTRVLAQSYRVPKAIHAVAVEWVEQISGREQVDYRPTDQEGKVVRHPHVGYQDWEQVIAMLKVMEQKGTVMVLVSCSYMLKGLIGELKRHRMAFHNPYRASQGLWNPLGRVDRLLAYLRPQNGLHGAEARLWTWEELHQWASVLQARGVIKHGGKAWIKSKAQKGRFDDHKKTVDLVALLNMFEDGHQEHIIEQDLDWWKNYLQAAALNAYRYPIALHQSRGGRVLLDKPNIIVGTIHSVKGGEADQVMLFPDMSPAGMNQWEDRRGGGRNAMRRLYYVGMTRARQELHLMGPMTPNHVPWP